MESIWNPFKDRSGKRVAACQVIERDTPIGLMCLGSQAMLFGSEDQKPLEADP